MFCSETIILDKTFEMIELEPSNPSSELCVFPNEMKKIMEKLGIISDEYTDTCIDEMRFSECYKRCHTGMAVGIDPNCLCRFAGRRNCMYKATIVAFIYKYTKNMSFNNWLRSLTPWGKHLLDKQISIYANNLFGELRPTDDAIYELSENLPQESCIVYMAKYDPEPYSREHAFLMISFENYFIIYDAWGHTREKWIRAMTKDQVFYILNTISQYIPIDTNQKKRRKTEMSEAEYILELIKYFFNPLQKHMDEYSHDINSTTFKFHYLPLSSKKFITAYESAESYKTIKFGGKRKKRILSRRKL